MEDAQTGRHRTKPGDAPSPLYAREEDILGQCRPDEGGHEQPARSQQEQQAGPWSARPERRREHHPDQIDEQHRTLPE